MVAGFPQAVLGGNDFLEVLEFVPIFFVVNCAGHFPKLTSKLAGEKRTFCAAACFVGRLIYPATIPPTPYTYAKAGLRPT